MTENWVDPPPPNKKFRSWFRMSGSDRTEDPEEGRHCSDMFDGVLVGIALFVVVLIGLLVAGVLKLGSACGVCP